MIVVDASVLIAFLDPNDAHHEAAVEILEDASPPLLLHPITAAEVLVAAVRNDVTDAVWGDLMAIGVEIDDTAIDPLLLAKLRVKTGCKMPDCCVLASATTRNTAVATVNERLRRHAAGDLS
ncbi:MAG: PIN domain-containing protein [Ilumatobacteraceae bacterium]